MVLKHLVILGGHQVLTRPQLCFLLLIFVRSHKAECAHGGVTVDPVL